MCELPRFCAAGSIEDVLMFDIAWSELALIGAVALVVIGPKDLPKVMRTMGQWTRKARLLAGEFHNNLDELMRQAELEDVRKQVASITPAAIRAKAESVFDPKDIEAAIVGDTKPSAPAAAAATAAATGEAAAAAEVPVLPEGVLPPVPPIEDPVAVAAGTPAGDDKTRAASGAAASGPDSGSRS